jgi:AraC-like DNA-binding protein
LNAVARGRTHARVSGEARADDCLLVFEDRVSDSPFVERVWRSHSERAGTFLSMAASHCGMVVTRHRGKTTMTVRGPETKATLADCPADAEWIGVLFAFGSFLPASPAATLRDRNDLTLPAANARSFWLNGSAWEYPSFENAETFVARLARAGLIARDPAVRAALNGDRQALSKRSAQRHFLQATGMTHGAHRQIERARRAANLLKQGMPIVETAHAAGYFDQAHLTRSLSRLIGETPARIRRQERQLSLLYKTPSSR